MTLALCRDAAGYHGNSSLLSQHAAAERAPLSAAGWRQTDRSQELFSLCAFLSMCPLHCLLEAPARQWQKWLRLFFSVALWANLASDNANARVRADISPISVLVKLQNGSRAEEEQEHGGALMKSSSEEQPERIHDEEEREVVSTLKKEKEEEQIEGQERKVSKEQLMKRGRRRKN
ncbi:hypothetical protein PAMP_008600 [Pampus punctatissimus]